MLNKPSAIENAFGKFILFFMLLLLTILLWEIELIIVPNNRACSQLCEQNGYNDSIAAESLCTCIKEDKDNKYVLQINMKTGEQVFFKKFDKNNDANNINTADRLRSG